MLPGALVVQAPHLLARAVKHHAIGAVTADLADPVSPNPLTMLSLASRLRSEDALNLRLRQSSRSGSCGDPLLVVGCQAPLISYLAFRGTSFTGASAVSSARLKIHRGEPTALTRLRPGNLGGFVGSVARLYWS